MDLGFSTDDYGLTEGDEILRSELLSHKLDLVLGNQSGIFTLIKSIVTTGNYSLEYVKDSVQCISGALKKYEAAVKHSLQQYAERNKNGRD